MKISKSKQELARIISENGGWREGAGYLAMDTSGMVCGYLSAPKWSSSLREWTGSACFRIFISTTLAPNHQRTILSREEYSHLYPTPDADGWIEHDGKHEPEISTSGLTIWCKWSDGLEQSHEANMVDWIDDSDVRIIAYRLHKPEQSKPEFCESVMRSIPEPTAKPTIEQLAADYRNAKDYAERKQQEADDAKGDANEALRKLEIAGEAIGMLLSPITEKQEPGLVIAVQVGDEVECIESNVNPNKYRGMIGTAMGVDDSSIPYLVDFGGEAQIWCHEVKFIRRP